MDNFKPIDDDIGAMAPMILIGADSVLSQWHAVQSALKPGRIEALLEGERWRAAIETGMVEHLYAFGQGVTEQIVQYGLAAEDARRLDASTRRQIEGHRNAYDVLVERVRSKEPVTPFFVRELHSAATAGQEHYEARDQFGKVVLRPLLHGAYKRQDNHVMLPDGAIHFYAPHVLVESEMDNLVAMLLKHDDWHPVLLAAFAHHRLTQIHPFEDGNGRVARLLADYYLTTNGYLPFIVNRTMRDSYLRSLREADAGLLAVLVDFLVETQRQEVARVESRAFSPDLATSVRAPEIARALASVIAARKKSPSSERLVKEEILTPLLSEAQSEINRRLEEIALQFQMEGVDLSWRFDALVWERVTADPEGRDGRYNIPSLPVRDMLAEEGLKSLPGVEVGYLRYVIITEGTNREYRLRAIMALTKTGYEKVALLTRGIGVDAHRPKIVDVGETPVRWDPWLDESLGRLVVSLAQR